MPIAKFGAPSSTYCSANGPWTMHSMSSRMAAWKYTPCSCFAQDKQATPSGAAHQACASSSTICQTPSPQAA